METMVMKAIERVRKSVTDPKPETIRLTAANSVGEWVRQGDVYLRIVDKIPEGAREIQDFNGQLAPGDTRGSRHCVDPKKVKAFALPNARIEDGSILQVLDNDEVTHPDHGHVALEKGLCIAVSFQVNEFQKQKQRVKD